MEDRKQEQQMPVITKETQVAIMKYFLDTSIPRMLKEQEEGNF